MRCWQTRSAQNTLLRSMRATPTVAGTNLPFSAVCVFVRGGKAYRPKSGSVPRRGASGYPPGRADGRTPASPRTNFGPGGRVGAKFERARTGRLWLPARRTSKPAQRRLKPSLRDVDKIRARLVDDGAVDVHAGARQEMGRAGVWTCVQFWVRAKLRSALEKCSPWIPFG